MTAIEAGLKVNGSAIALNIILALVKISTGIVGNSYARIACLNRTCRSWMW
ncbi:MAG: hypothetical protein H8E28_00720 [Anaerolineae bacterium]|nr:hypothetical protein [Anaerolineae bacterium]